MRAMNRGVRVYYAIWLTFGMAMGLVAFAITYSAP